MTHQPMLTLSVTTTEAIAANLWVDAAGNIASSGESALGVTEYSVGSGDDAPIHAMGVVLVKAGAAIAQGARVQVGTGGKTITLAAGVDKGMALDAAGADGAIIRVLIKS